MRKRITGNLLLFLVSCVVHAGDTQPNIPNEKIPDEVRADVRQQIERLHSENAGKRASAASELGKMGERAAAAVPFLVGMLDDDDPYGHDGGDFPMLEVHESMARALVRIGSPAVKPVAYALRDENRLIRIRASDVLAGIGPPAVEELIAVLADKDANARAAAIRALGRIEDPRVADPVVSALNDKDVTVRSSAVWAIVAVKDPRAVDTLIVLLKHNWVAARALGEIKDVRAVEPLMAAMEDERAGLRKAAAVALGKIADPRAIGCLIAALKDEEERVRTAAAEALGHLKDPRAVKPLIDILGDTGGNMGGNMGVNVRGRARGALAEIGEPAVLPLIAALKDEDRIVRGAAARLLGGMMDTRAVEGLAAALGDDDRDVRHYAAQALGKIGDGRGVEALIAAMNDENLIPVGRTIEEALLKLTGRDFNPPPKVRIPIIVREDLVATAADLCHKAYPETPTAWFAKQFAEYVAADSWTVRATGKSHRGPMVRLEAGFKVTLSFPDGGTYQLLTNNQEPRGLLSRPGAEKRSLTLEEAFDEAQGLFRRLVPDVARRKEFQLKMKKRINSSHEFRWESPLGPGHRDTNRVSVSVNVATGVIRSCTFTDFKAPVVRRRILPLEKILAHAQRQRKYVTRKNLKLVVQHSYDRKYLCWEYRDRPAPATDHVTQWEACTGELVYSNEYDDEGRALSGDAGYYAPKYLPYLSYELKVQRLEELAGKRAAALEAERIKHRQP